MIPMAQRSRKGKPAHEILTISQGSALRKIGADAFMEFINTFVDERAYLTIQEKATLKREMKWLEKTAREIDRGEKLALLLFVDGKIAGNCEVRRGEAPDQMHNVTFGIAIRKEFRGMGFGELLLQSGIEAARKRFRPRNMWVDHYAKNRVAAQLYRKVGFVEVARLREYHSHYGTYDDKVIMEYRKKR
jgi:RimJ/RimL family protein N-acetyltransferase